MTVYLSAFLCFSLQLFFFRFSSVKQPVLQISPVLSYPLPSQICQIFFILKVAATWGHRVEPFASNDL